MTQTFWAIVLITSNSCLADLGGQMCISIASGRRRRRRQSQSHCPFRWLPAQACKCLCLLPIPFSLHSVCLTLWLRVDVAAEGDAALSAAMQFSQRP